VIVSEPSNHGRGVATLTRPSSSLHRQIQTCDDGFFCQWIQLYQLALPIVPDRAKSARLFPHVQSGFEQPPTSWSWLARQSGTTPVLTAVCLTRWAAESNEPRG